jgi:hypothetical protein
MPICENKRKGMTDGDVKGQAECIPVLSLGVCLHASHY